MNLSTSRQRDFNWTWFCGLAAAVLMLAGCSARTVSVQAQAPAALQLVHQAYAVAIESAHRDARLRWHHGRLGNITVNNEGFPNVGLCHHWQQMVFHQVKPTVDRLGWHAVGVAINEGSYFEHHAVLIYNPRQIKLDQILKTPYSPQVYILDPWRSGTAQIFQLSEWLKLPLLVKRPARLTQIIPKPELLLSQRDQS